MSKIVPMGKVDDLRFLLVICQIARDEPEAAMDSLAKWMLSKARKGRVHRISYLAGLIHGAILRSIHTDSLSHRIPEILRTYGKPRNDDAS